MKKAIITPTFKPHFKFVDKYLESAKKYVSDPENVTFYLTVSESDVAELSSLVSKYSQNLNVEILCFDKIIKKFNIPYSDKVLLSKYGKFSYQTLKKFYTMLYIQAEQMLVLDSESMFVKPTNIRALFDDFFDNPFITVCNLDQLPYVGNFKKKVMENISFAINGRSISTEDNESQKKLELYTKNRSSLNDIWFLENFVWFYDRKILNDMCNKLGEPFTIVDRIYNNVKKDNVEQGCFEICLYQGFIYRNNNAYNYTVLHTEDIVQNAFRDNMHIYSKYEKNYYSLWGGEFGILEMAMGLLDKENYKLLANEFKKNNFNIIRCDFTNLINYKYQMEFLDILKPNILAASQNHIYGVNNKLGDKLWNLLFWNNSFARYVYSDLKAILKPFLPFFIWCKRFFYIVKHTTLWTLQALKNIEVFRK